MDVITPIVLAGGSGTRLWPLSRKSYPKQFSVRVDEKSLFQASAQRLTSSGIVNFEQQITLTNADFRFIVGEQLTEVGIDPGPIIIEPEVKNTAGPILAASIFTLAKDENAILLVSPSDHVLPDKTYFHKAINVGLSHVKTGKMVTFGIKPTNPEVGYGYLKLSPEGSDAFGVSKVERFIEKPILQKAIEMVASGDYFWNAGIFMFRAKDMVEAFENFAPEILKSTAEAVKYASVDLGFLRLAPGPWSALPDVSIDYAIMEKAQNIVAIRYEAKWSDLGGWGAVWAEGKKDSDGNVFSGLANAIECSGSLLRSESENQHIVGLGLENIIAIAMPDAVLVADKNRAQDVKAAVELCKSKNIKQAEVFPRDYRPWGWFESLALSDVFQVKRIHVNPGAALSLQSHKYRSEHWVVVEGDAKVTIDDCIKIVKAGESVFVPLGAIHRMENPGETELVLIEIQLGSYLGEDDIVRYEDIYSRT